MLISSAFEFTHNRDAALWQEFELAQQEYDAVRLLPVFTPSRSEKYRAARERLNRARELLADA